MSEPASKLELFCVASGAVREPAPLELIMTLEPGGGPVRLEWQRKVDATPVGQANVAFEPGPFGIGGLPSPSRTFRRAPVVRRRLGLAACGVCDAPACVEKACGLPGAAGPPRRRRLLALPEAPAAWMKRLRERA
jgi:hypothetical protein